MKKLSLYLVLKLVVLETVHGCAGGVFHSFGPLTESIILPTASNA